jgi:pimeloyl-ACP methyl ester carboxylesterase
MSAAATVRAFEPHEWRTYRELRLRALADAPDAFASTLAEEQRRSDAGWSEMLAASAASSSQISLVAELQRIELGGFPQTVLLRGVDRRNPVLLYVHGGPGSAQLPIARLYSNELEKRFVVAHWDQRGAGASCEGVDWRSLSLVRIVADAIELAEKLGPGDGIFRIGHSWGSLVGALAVQRRPDLFRAYVGLGQLVERDAQEKISYDWVVEQARRAGDSKALAELATRLRYTTCFERSLEVLLPDRLHVDLLTGMPRLEVPVFLFAGRHDYNTPFALVEPWASRLQAPHVELVWFEGAGHLIPIEAPEEFQTRLLEKLLPLAERTSS